MRLDDDQIDLLRANFRLLASDSRGTAALFYARLFDLAPETRPLFRGDLDVQGDKLMNMLGVLVARLHEFDTLLPMLEDLGRRHVHYGVEARHYAVLGEALLWLVETRTEACAETRSAWLTAYRELTRAMLASAERAPRMAAPRQV
jgi:nitric oxide dioxygenase